MKYKLPHLFSWILIIWGSFDTFGLSATILAAGIHGFLTWAIMILAESEGV